MFFMKNLGVPVNCPVNQRIDMGIYGLMDVDGHLTKERVDTVDGCIGEYIYTYIYILCT